MVDVTQDLVVIVKIVELIRHYHESSRRRWEVIEALKDRILGRVTVADVVNPENQETLIPVGVLLDEDMVNIIESKGVDELG